MAKKKPTGDEEEGAAKKSKKKPAIILIVVLGVVGAKMFLLKPAVKTPAQLAFEKKQADEALYNTCAEANHKPKLPPLTVDTSAVPPTTKAKGSGAVRDGAPRAIAVRLIASQTEGTPAKPIVDGMGPVLQLDSVTLNLSDGSYLKLGLGLQLAVDVDASAAKDQGFGAKALDMALTELSKHTMKELVPPAKRDAIKDDLGFTTCRAYDAKITTVYFTEFVMQAPA